MLSSDFVYVTVATSGDGFAVHIPNGQAAVIDITITDDLDFRYLW